MGVVQTFCLCPPLKGWRLCYCLSHTSSTQAAASHALPLQHPFAWYILKLQICCWQSIKDMRKQTRARIKPQRQQPVLQDEVSIRECTLSWVVKPPSDFLFLLSVITEQITLLWDSIYIEVIFQFYISLFHLPVLSVPANHLCCDANVLVCLISFICPQQEFLKFWISKKKQKIFFSVSVDNCLCWNFVGIFYL